jgi:hypothetical protein
VIYVEKGCTQCDGPTEAIERVSTVGESAAVEAEPRELFEPAAGYISSSWISPDGHEIWLTVCSRGYCGGVGEISGDAQTTLYNSNDGGITWETLETADGSVGVVGFTAIGPILARTERQSDGQFTTTFFAHQGGTVIPPPQPGAHPLFGANGSVLVWGAQDGRSILRSDGSVIFAADEQFFVAGAPHPENEVFLLGFRPEQPTDPVRYALIEDGEIVREFRGGPSGLTLWIGAWLDNRTALGNASLLPSGMPGIEPGQDEREYQVPVRIDLETGELTPFELYGPLLSSDYHGRNRVRAIDTGSTSEGDIPYVVDAGGDCLNVRDTPSLGSPSARCYEDGVIVWALSEETTEAEGVAWLNVHGPGINPGWASSEFLRR